MKQARPQGDVTLTQLRTLVSRMFRRVADSSDLDFDVFPGGTRVQTYIIEISKGRYTRSVIVDPAMVRHLEAGNLDVNLQREVRIAMLTVSRWAQDRK